MTDVKLPPLPETEYLLGVPARPYEPEWISSMDAYDADAMQAYARLAVLQERERCAKICDEIEDKAYALWKITADPTEQGRELGACHCADAIRKGE